MKDSYEQRIQNQFGAFCVKVLKNEARHIQREYADALAQLPKGKRDVILLSYFLDMTDREISEKLNIVHQTVSKRRRATLKELREYLVKEGFEWPDE